jgi:hypothetical protein
MEEDLFEFVRLKSNFDSMIGKNNQIDEHW